MSGASGYAIRFRCADRDGEIALILEDGRGAAYLFSGGALQVRLTGGGAPARLARLLERSAACAAMPVPEVALYTLDELYHLVPTQAGIGLPGREA